MKQWFERILSIVAAILMISTAIVGAYPFARAAIGSFDLGDPSERLLGALERMTTSGGPSRAAPSAGGGDKRVTIEKDLPRSQEQEKERQAAEAADRVERQRREEEYRILRERYDPRSLKQVRDDARGIAEMDVAERQRARLEQAAQSRDAFGSRAAVGFSLLDVLGEKLQMNQEIQEAGDLALRLRSIEGAFPAPRDPLTGFTDLRLDPEISKEIARELARPEPAAGSSRGASAGGAAGIARQFGNSISGQFLNAVKSAGQQMMGNFFGQFGQYGGVLGGIAANPQALESTLLNFGNNLFSGILGQTQGGLGNIFSGLGGNLGNRNYGARSIGSGIGNPTIYPNSQTILATQLTVPGKAGSTDIFQPVFEPSGTANIVSALSSCPDPARAGPTTCVIDDAFRAAIEQGLTVRKAMERGDLKGDAVFAFRSDGLEPSFREGYPYRSMVILRTYRIIPIGWELAAQYIKAHESKTLAEVVAGFADSVSPFYGLVDPNWVLTSPELFCRRTGPGAELVDNQVIPGSDANGDGDFEDQGDVAASRRILRNQEYCADSQTCLEKSTDGRCKYFGYCSKEKRIWALNGRQCDPVFSSCQTFVLPGGGTVNYLKNTLNYQGCTSLKSVGCGAYAKRKAGDQWSDSAQDKIYLNRSSKQCDAENVGCREFYRVSKNGESWSADQSKDRELNALVSQVTATGADTPATYGSVPGVSTESIFLRYINYNPEGNQCEPSEVGCDRYTPVGSADTLVVPAVVKPQDRCNAQCVGLDRYRQVATAFETPLAAPSTGGAYLRFNERFSGSSERGGAENVWRSDAPDNREHWKTLSSPSGNDHFVALGGRMRTVLPQGALDPSKTYIFSSRAFKGTTTPDNLTLRLRVLRGEQELALLSIIPAPSRTTAVDRAEWQQIEKNFTIANIGSGTTPMTLELSISQIGSPNTSYVAPSDAAYGSYTKYIYVDDIAITDQDARIASQREQVVLMPKAAQQCAVENAGCDEFTNLDEIARGGEIKSYFKGLKFCKKPSEVPIGSPASDKALYIIERGSDRTGYQISTHELLAEGTAENSKAGPPCTALNEDGSCHRLTERKPGCASDRDECLAASCDHASDIDCREFVALDHKTYRRKYSRTITVSDQCHPFRRTKLPHIAIRAQELDCAATGGAWGDQGCVYKLLPVESSSCGASAKWCRQYQNSTSANVRVILDERFDDERASSRWAGEGAVWALSSQSEWGGGRAMEISNNETTMSIAQATQAVDGSRQSILAVPFEAGKQYLLSFWANHRGENAGESARIRLTAEETTGSNRLSYTFGPAEGMVITKELPQIYTVGPLLITKALDPAKSPVIRVTEIADHSSGIVALDNIRIQTADQYLVSGSWLAAMPDQCKVYDSSVPIGDATHPNSGDSAQAPCRAYVAERSGQQVALKSFSNLCKEAHVGCIAAIDTKNSTSPKQRLPEGDEPPATEVQADAVRYIIDNPRNYCPQEAKGCSIFGNITEDSRTSAREFSNSVVLDDPDRYSSMLCTEAEVGCQAYNTTTGDQVMFKDPGTAVCDYYIKEGETKPKWWRRRYSRTDPFQECPKRNDAVIGSNGPVTTPGVEEILPERRMSPELVQKRYWAGTCPGTANSCTELIDTRSQIATGIIANSDFSQRLNAIAAGASPQIPCSGEPDHWKPVDNNRASTQYRLLTPKSTACVVGNAQQPVQVEPNRLYVVDVVGKGTVTARVGECGPLDAVEFRSPDDSMTIGKAGNDPFAEFVLATPPQGQGSTTPAEGVVSGRFILRHKVGQPITRRCVLSVSIPSNETDSYIKNVNLKPAGVYYAIENTLSNQGCNGVVNPDIGCVLFNNRAVVGNIGAENLIKNPGFETLTTVQGATAQVPTEWKTDTGADLAQANSGQFPVGPGVEGSRAVSGTTVTQRVKLDPGVEYRLEAVGSGGFAQASRSRIAISCPGGASMRITAVSQPYPSTTKRSLMYLETNLTGNQKMQEVPDDPGIEGVQAALRAANVRVLGAEANLWLGTRAKYFFQFIPVASQPTTCAIIASAGVQGMVDNIALFRLTNEYIQNVSELHYDANRVGENNTAYACGVQDRFEKNCQPNANVLVNAKPDRQCGEWLSCRSALQTKDSRGNTENLCFDVASCTQMGANGECLNFNVLEKKPEIYTASTQQSLKDKSGYTKAGYEWSPVIMGSSRSDGGSVSTTVVDPGLAPALNSGNPTAKLYPGYGLYPVAKMTQVGNLVRIGNGGFEDASTVGRPKSWKTESLDKHSSFAPAWHKGIFEAINNPLAAQKEGVEPFDGLSYLAVRGDNRAVTSPVEAFGSTRYAVSVALNTIGLKSDEFGGSRTHAQLIIRQFDDAQKQISDPCATASEHISDLAHDAGLDWKEKSFRFTTCPDTRALQLVLLAINPRRGDELGQDPLAKPEGSFYADNIQIAPVLEVSSQERFGSAQPVDTVRSCRLYPTADAPSCQFQNTSGVRFRGQDGYCLERDPNNKDVCIQWYPVDVIAGNERGESAMDYRGRAPLYYCTEMKIFETRAYWRSFQGMWASQGFGWRSVLSAASVFVLPTNITGLTTGWQRWSAALSILGASGKQPIERPAYSSCMNDPGYGPWEDVQRGSSWTGRDVYRNGCQAKGTVWFTTPDPENPQFPKKWYEYNGTQAEINELDTRPNRANAPAPIHFVEEIRPFCMKIVKVAQGDGANKAWSGRLQEGGIRYVQDLGYTYGYDGEPFGAVTPPSEGDPDDPSTWKLDMPLPITDSQSVARAGAPYACSSHDDPLVGKSPVCQISFFHGVAIQTPNGATPYPTGGLESCEDAKNRLKTLFWGTYGTWEWGGRCVDNTKQCTNTGDNRSCISDADCAQFTPSDACNKFIDDNKPIVDGKKIEEPPRQTLERVCAGTSPPSSCTVDCALQSAPSNSCTLRSGVAPKICYGGLKNGSACSNDIDCRGTMRQAGYVPLSENNVCNWTKPAEQCSGNKRPVIEFAYCKGANDYIYKNDPSQNPGKCVGGPRNGEQCLTRNPNDLSQLASSAQGCPAGKSDAQGVQQDANLDDEYCAVAPVVREARVNTTQVKNSGFVNLRFTSEVDPNQLPMTAYSVDWGDGETATLSGVEIRSRSNMDNPHSLFHLYSYWDMVQKIGAGKLPQSACDRDSGICTARIRIQIRDKWGWCNGNGDTAGFQGAGCNESDAWKIVSESITVLRDRDVALPTTAAPPPPPSAPRTAPPQGSFCPRGTHLASTGFDEPRDPSTLPTTAEAEAEWNFANEASITIPNPDNGTRYIGDATGNGHVGTAWGVLPYYENGQLAGYMLVGNNGNSGMSIGNLNINQSQASDGASFELWLKGEVPNGVYMSTSNVRAMGWGISARGGKWYVLNGLQEIDTGIIAARSSHVVAVFDPKGPSNAKVRFYSNGRELFKSSQIKFSGDQGHFVEIGNDFQGTHTPAGAIIQKARIYNVALTSEQVGRPFRDPGALEARWIDAPYYSRAYYFTCESGEEPGAYRYGLVSTSGACLAPGVREDQDMNIPGAATVRLPLCRYAK